MPSYTRALIGGIAVFLDAAGVGAWDDFGTLPRSDADPWLIYLGPDMPGTPDAAIVLTPGVQTFVRADVVTNVQIRIRGNADATYDEVGDKAQEIHDLFYPRGLPLAHVTMGPIRVGAVLPGDTLPLSTDAERRHGHIQNFRIRTRRVSATLPVSAPGGFGNGGFGR